MNKKSRLSGITKSLSHFFALALLLGMGNSAFATSAVIDFEGYDLTGANNHPTLDPYIDVDGYRFTLSSWADGAVFSTDSAAVIDSGSTKLFVANGADITMSRIDGRAFDLTRMDIAGSYIGIGDTWADSVDIVAGSSTTTSMPTGAYVTLDLNYTNVTSILFDQINAPDEYKGFVVDNLHVNTSPVPIPAAVWLFGSGVVGLFGFAKRKQA